MSDIEGKAATGSGERSGTQASFKLVSRVCEKCGWEIPADAPERGCPGCLLESGLRLLEEERETSNAQRPTSNSEGKHVPRNPRVWRQISAITNCWKRSVAVV